MTWEDRVRAGVYTSPQGTRIEFSFEDVSRTVELRTVAFGFPTVDGEYVQQNGFGSRKYPLRCIFWGPNYDVDATRFEAALLESGIGRLQHPFYGTFDVVPFGEFTRRDDLKTAANQAIVEVTFWTTIRAIYPTALVDPENEIATMVATYWGRSADQFGGLTDLTTAAKRAAAKGTIRGLLDTVSSTLETVSDTVQSVNRTFQDARSTINYGLDVFIGQPLLLAQQIKDLLSAPSRALDGIKSRLDAYGDLADSIFGSSAGDPASTLSDVPAAVSGRIALTERASRVSNDFHISDMFASQTVASAALSTLPGTNAASRPVGQRTFRTRPEAVRAAEALVTMHDALVVWRDAGFTALAAIDKIGSYQSDPGDAASILSNAVALAAGNAIRLSFELAPERSVVLDRPRTIVDLCGELYGTVDPRDGIDYLDFMIESNDLNGDEILEIPRGRKILYYA